MRHLLVLHLRWHSLITGLPSETLRIAARALKYLESNAQPLIHAGDEFLRSVSKEDMYPPIIDTITENQVEEPIEELLEVTDVDNELEEEKEDSQEQYLYERILPDKEKRKMEKVRADAEKSAEREKKRLEREAAKVRKEKEKL